MTSLSNKAAYLIVLNLIKYAIGFFVPIFVARLLTKEDYGAYQQILLLANTSVGVMVLGIPLSIYYFYNQSIESINRKTLVTHVHAIIICVILMLLFCIRIYTYDSKLIIADYIQGSAKYIHAAYLFYNESNKKVKSKEVGGK